MAATQTEIIAERRKEKKRAEARGEGDMVEGYDPVVPPPPNVAPPLPPETEGYDPVVDPPRPVYKGFKAPPGMTADQRQRWQQSIDTRLSGKEDRALERGKQDTEDLLSGIGEQAGKVYGDLDEMATKALQYPVKFARAPMGESEKLSGTAIEMGKGLAQTAAAPLELSADITAGRTTPRAVEKQASDTAKRYARALASGDIEDRIKATQELSAATSLGDPTLASDLVYAGASFAEGDVKNGMASLLAALAAGGLSVYTINNVKKSLAKDMTDKGMDAANAEKVADRAVDKAEETINRSPNEAVAEAAAAWHRRKSQLVLEDKSLQRKKSTIEEKAPKTAAVRSDMADAISEASQLIDEVAGEARLGPPEFKLNEAGNPAVFWHWDEVDEIIDLYRQQGNIEKAERLTELRNVLDGVSGNPDVFEKLRSDIPSNVAVQAEMDAAVGQRVSAAQAAKAEAEAARQAELARLEADAQAQFKAREDAKVAATKAEEQAQVDKLTKQSREQRYVEKQRELEAERKVEAEDVSDEPTVRGPLVDEDGTDMPTSPTPATLAGQAIEKGTSMRKAQEAFGDKPPTQAAKDAQHAMLRLRRQAFKKAPGETPPVRLASTEMGAPAPKPKAEAPRAEAPKAPEAPKTRKQELEEILELDASGPSGYAGGGEYDADHPYLTSPKYKKMIDDAQKELNEIIRAERAGGGKPAPTKATTSEAPGLSNKTIKQLKAYAKSEGISLGSARRKADILRRIEEGSDGGSAIAKARKEAQQPPKKKAKKPDPEPDPAGKPPGGGEVVGPPSGPPRPGPAKIQTMDESGLYPGGQEYKLFSPRTDSIYKGGNVIQTSAYGPSDLRIGDMFETKYHDGRPAIGVMKADGVDLFPPDGQDARKLSDIVKKRYGKPQLAFPDAAEEIDYFEGQYSMGKYGWDEDIPPGGLEYGPAPKTRKVKVRTRGRDAPDDIERSGDVSKTATFVETEPVRGARTSAPFKVQKSTLTKSMSRYSDPKNRTKFAGKQDIVDHATNLADKLEGVPPSAVRRQFDKIRVNMGVSRIGEGTGPTTAVVGGKKTALSGPGKILSETGELSRRRGVKTKARVAERDLVAVETAYNEMAESASIVKKSQSDLDDVLTNAAEMNIPPEEAIKPHIRLLEEYEASVKKYEELSGAFAKRFL